MGVAQSTRRSTDRDHALPTDAVQRIASYLLGIDVIQYSRAVPAVRAALNAPTVWARRIEPSLPLFQTRAKMPSSCCFDKAMYLQQRALLFNEPAAAGQTWRARLLGLTQTRYACGDFAALHDLPMIRMQPFGFSFELTFSVAPIHKGASTCHGGILLGFQSTHCWESGSVTPDAFFSFISIDSNGGLHFAEEQATPETSVTATVTFDRWHHVVLAFDGQYLRAYLDGVLWNSKLIPRALPWTTLAHGQIGTGFGYDPNGPHAADGDQHATWRPFHGLVVQARVWGVNIDEGHARRLARGLGVTSQSVLSILQEPHGPRRVITTRPCERYAQIMRN